MPPTFPRPNSRSVFSTTVTSAPHFCGDGCSNSRPAAADHDHLFFHNKKSSRLSYETEGFSATPQMSFSEKKIFKIFHFIEAFYFFRTDLFSDNASPALYPDHTVASPETEHPVRMKLHHASFMNAATASPLSSSAPTNFSSLRNTKFSSAIWRQPNPSFLRRSVR